MAGPSGFSFSDVIVELKGSMQQYHYQPSVPLEPIRRLRKLCWSKSSSLGPGWCTTLASLFGNVYILIIYDICIDIVIPLPDILGHHHNARNEGSGYLLVELTLDTWGGYYYSALFIIIIISSVRSSNSHPDLLLIHHHPTHFFQI